MIKLSCVKRIVLTGVFSMTLLFAGTAVSAKKVYAATDEVNHVEVESEEHDNEDSSDIDDSKANDTETEEVSSTESESETSEAEDGKTEEVTDPEEKTEEASEEKKDEAEDGVDAPTETEENADAVEEKAADEKTVEEKKVEVEKESAKSVVKETQPEKLDSVDDTKNVKETKDVKEVTNDKKKPNKNVTKKPTGLVKNNGVWNYVVDGKVQKDFTGVKSNQYGYWYVENGAVNFGKNGFVKAKFNNKNSWLYIVNGEVMTKTTSVLQGTVKGEDAWWYVENGKVNFTDTIAKNDYGWWRIKNGKVDFSCNTIEKNQYGWFKCKNGKVDFSCNTIEQNQYGWFKCKNGKVDFSCNTIEKNQYGWFKCKNGKVDFDCNTIEKNQYGWFKCKNGKVDFSFNGVGENQYGRFYCKDGKVVFYTNGYLVKGGKTYKFNGKGHVIDEIDGLVPMTEMPGFFISNMYAGNLNTREERIEAMIKRAYEYLNTEYAICKSERPGEQVDCSGLVMQCLYAAGFDPSPANPEHHSHPENEYDSRTLWSSVPMKHINVSKDGSKYTEKGNVDYSKLRRGDLIYYKSPNADIINHVAIYLGDDKVIEAVAPYVMDWLGLIHEVHGTIYGVTRPFE